MKISSTTYQTHNGYELSDLPIVIGISNTRVVLTDKRVSTYTSGLLTSVSTDVVSWQDFYSGGWVTPGRMFSTSDYRYGAFGMEMDNEVKSKVGTSIDFGDRWYDPRVIVWGSKDKFDEEYAGWSPYNFAHSSPITIIDKEGERIFFAAGAGNDTKGWNYSERFKVIFEGNGISDFVKLNATNNSQRGAIPGKDILFSGIHSTLGRVTTKMEISINPFDGIKITQERITDKIVNKAVGDILESIANNPLADGEQLNLAGYSYGSVLQAHIALQLTDKGIKVDNLILIGSPISDDSPLYQELVQLEKEGKIGKIHREDIPGDYLSNPKNDYELGVGLYQNRDPNNIGDGPHFDFARPDNPTTEKNEAAEANNKIRTLTKKLVKEGVK